MSTEHFDIEDLGKHVALVKHIVRGFSNYTNNNPDTFDELVSIGSIGLVKAYHRFDWDRGIKFATFASMCITNEILMHMRVERRRSPLSTKSLSTVMVEDDNTGIELEDMLGTGDDLTAVDIKLFYDTLSSRDKYIVMMTSSGYMQAEIAKRIGVSQSMTSRLLAEIGRKYLRYKEGRPERKRGKGRSKNVSDYISFGKAL